jgi:hypothetical protein
LLELVIHEFDNGATPESIVDSYPVVELPDVYSVLAYYLNHRDEVQEYLSRRDKQAAIIRAKIEGSQEDLGDLRHRIQQMKVKRD